LNCTISGNTNTSIHWGAGVIGFCYIAPCLIRIESCTITNNSAPIPANNIGAGVALVDPIWTVAGMPQFHIRNSVIAGNHSGGGYDTAGVNMTSLGGNFFGDAVVYSTQAPIWLSPQAGDQFGTHTAPLDPMLDPLSSNGGPTRTHRPVAGSPLLDTAQPGVTQDQRGVARGSQPDKGAVEVTPRVLAAGGPLAFPATSVGSFSAAQSLVLETLDISGVVTLTPPANFEVSLAPATGFASQPLLFPASASLTTVYVRYAPAAPGPHSDFVYVAPPPGALTITVAVSGSTPSPGKSGGGRGSDDSSCSSGNSGTPGLCVLLAIMCATWLLRCARSRTQ
jgi:hypothetical protein